MIQNQAQKADLHDFNGSVVWRTFKDYHFGIGNSFG